jgi:hypothetical protein
MGNVISGFPNSGNTLIAGDIVRIDNSGLIPCVAFAELGVEACIGVVDSGAVNPHAAIVNVALSGTHRVNLETGIIVPAVGDRLWISATQPGKATGAKPAVAFSVGIVTSSLPTNHDFVYADVNIAHGIEAVATAQSSVSLAGLEKPTDAASANDPESDQILLEWNVNLALVQSTTATVSMNVIASLDVEPFFPGEVSVMIGSSQVGVIDGTVITNVVVNGAAEVPLQSTASFTNPQANTIVQLLGRAGAADSGGTPDPLTVRGVSIGFTNT